MRDVSPGRSAGATTVAMSWSGGKDSGLALHALLMDPTMRVRALLTTVTEGYDRVSIHGVRRELVAEQGRALALPVVESRIPAGATNARYEESTLATLSELRKSGVEAVAFGDLLLEDVRSYRERLVESAGLTALFPLWGRDTGRLAREFLSCGFRAVVVCVDPLKIDRRFCGREYDADLLAELPVAADPCGENGEFHTFVYDAPMFDGEVEVARGEVVERDGFVFCDLLRRDAGGATSGDAARSGIPRAIED